MADLTDQEIERLDSAWSAVEKACALPDYGPSYQIDTNGAIALGRLMYDYMTSTISDSNWEGFKTKHFDGIKDFLSDIAIYAEACEDEYKRAEGGVT